jgi:hypothetical protein
MAMFPGSFSAGDILIMNELEASSLSDLTKEDIAD